MGQEGAFLFDLLLNQLVESFPARDVGFVRKTNRCSFGLFSVIYHCHCFFSNFCLGSGSAEGFHSRLEKIMPHRALALDDMVEFLTQEDEFWDCRAHDSRLWKEKKNQYETSHERHREKRRCLSHYYERKNLNDRKSQSLSVFDTFENVDDLFQTEKEIKDTEEDGMFFTYRFNMLFIY